MLHLSVVLFYATGYQLRFPEPRVLLQPIGSLHRQGRRALPQVYGVLTCYVAPPPAVLLGLLPCYGFASQPSRLTHSLSHSLSVNILRGPTRRLIRASFVHIRVVL